jgi:hypothetical protein
MHRSLIFIACMFISGASFSQIAKERRLERFGNGQLFDQWNIYLEFNTNTWQNMGDAGGSNFIQSFVPISRYNVTSVFAPKLNLGFYPVKRLNLGWGFNPYFLINHSPDAPAIWNTGPYIKYYIPLLKRKTCRHWFAFYPYAQYYFGNMNFDTLASRPHLTQSISVGTGMNFRLYKYFSMHIELGARIFPNDYNASYWINVDGGIGINYSIPTKRKNKF